MNDLKRQLQLVNCRGEMMDCILKIETGDICRIQLNAESVEELSVEQQDLFTCLVRLRLILERIDLMIACNGARENVYPSRMSRQMSKGVMAYACHLGRPATEKDIVNIFDPAPFDTLSSVSKQKAFHRKWLNSLGSNKSIWQGIMSLFK